MNGDHLKVRGDFTKLPKAIPQENYGLTEEVEIKECSNGKPDQRELLAAVAGVKDRVLDLDSSVRAEKKRKQLERLAGWEAVGMSPRERVADAAGCWTCPTCGWQHMNSRITKCKCGTQKGGPAIPNWDCERCGFDNFNWRPSCFHCGIPRN